MEQSIPRCYLFMCLPHDNWHSYISEMYAVSVRLRSLCRYALGGRGADGPTGRVLAAAWDKWRERFLDIRLQPVVRGLAFSISGSY